MNIKLSRNNVRFRISKDELERLQKDGALEEVTCLPGRLLFRYQVVIVGDEALPVKAPLGLSFTGSRLTLSVARPALNSLAESIPSREGLSWEENEPLGFKLGYALEVDIRA